VPVGALALAALFAGPAVTASSPAPLAGKPAVWPAKIKVGGKAAIGLDADGDTLPVGEYRYQRLSDPARTCVTDSAGNWLATFTDGAFTVCLAGPARTFAERTATYPVRSGTWVRALPAPFARQPDVAWLEQALRDTSPDVLQTAMQYIENAPSFWSDGGGRRIGGDAAYGPLQADGTRQEGSDFNDYLGIAWTYASGTRAFPDAPQLGCLDCSGFVRMVLGYRGGLPLSLSADGGRSLPRRAYQMLDAGPGIVTIANRGRQVTDFSALAPGDLVFFDASVDDGKQIDHVGVYLGRDTGGNHRFVSSRKSINGPTLGDYNGRSILNGTGLYAKAFRAVRRL
jgi:cell wall-associated NlpC family hydrolase